MLSRLYTPSDTAHYALLLGIGVVLASFAGLRLDLAVPIPSRLDDSRGIFWLATLAPLLVLPIVGLIVFGASVAGLWGGGGNLYWIDYLAVAAFVILLGLFTAASQLAIRLRAYGVLSRIPVVQMAGTLIAQVSLGLAGVSRGLFLGGLVGRSLGIVGLLRSSDVRMNQIPNRRETRRLLRRYWRFPVIFAPASFVEVLGSNLAALMLPALFGLGPAGLYAMAVRVSAVPAAVISQSAGQVLLGEFARATSRSASLRIFFRWSAALLTMGILVASVIWVLAPLVLPKVLGEGWSGTVQLAQYGGIMAGAALVGSPVQHVWTVRQRGLMQFSWNLIRLATTAWVLWAGSRSGGSLADAIADLAVVTIGVYALAWLGCLWAAARPSADRRSDVGKFDSPEVTPG